MTCALGEQLRPNAPGEKTAGEDSTNSDLPVHQHRQQPVAQGGEFSK